MNVIITGASRGLGFEIAKKFLQEGHNIAICSRNLKDLHKTSQELKKFNLNRDQIIYYEDVDISKEVHCDIFVENCIDSFGKIDVLVNNAGVYGPKGKIEDVSNQDWKEAIDINLMGPFYMMKHIIPHMKENKYGKIINLSGGGATNPLPNISAYAASKTALVRLTESIALECKDYNIGINSIAPGLLDTRLFDEIMEVGAEVVGEEFYNKIKNQEKTPLSVGADLCLWLASKESDGITGKLISAKWDDYKNFKDLDDDIYTLKRKVPEDRNKNWKEKIRVCLEEHTK